MSDEKQYPCAKCGKLRTKAEGGTVFTVCDACWDGEPMVGDYESNLATVTAERDRLKRLVESARVIHLDNHYQIVQTCGDFILFDDVDKFVSRHDTVLEAFEAIPNSES